MPATQNPPNAVMTDPHASVDAVIERVGRRIVLALPLGLGKANHVANAFYERAQADPGLTLHIVTALTLETPTAPGDLAGRLLEPLKERLYAGYPELHYAVARRRGTLPANITVSEVYLNPGKLLSNAQAQQHYFSSNYTHAVRDLLDVGVNVVAQMVAPHSEGEGRYSLSCNTDVTLDLVARAREHQHELCVVGQVNRRLPWLGNDAEVDAGFFDLLVDAGPDQPAGDFPLYPIPKIAVDTTDWAIATRVAGLIRDGGTIQVGIGSLGDAIAGALVLRHRHNASFNQVLDQLQTSDSDRLRPNLVLERGAFERGLYANSEMVVEGLLHLRRQGVLTRQVYDDVTVQTLVNRGLIGETLTPDTLRTLLREGVIDNPLTAADVAWLKAVGIFREEVSWRDGALVLPDGTGHDGRLDGDATLESLCRQALSGQLPGGIYCHGGFYLGSAGLYEQLHQLSDGDRAGLNMTAISYINQLYGDEALKRAQRVEARFVNSAMMVTLAGEVVSDGLGDHRVVSGVGGQYNFVAQAQELADGRSVICLPSTRVSKGERRSNIVWEYPHTTIPRHLRDIVVTEYGVADLRGQPDREVMVRMLAIADAQFQDTLLRQAQAAGKIEADYRVPEAFRHNTPQRLRAVMHAPGVRECFAYFPLGTDFTPAEAVASIGLGHLKAHSGDAKAMARLLWCGWRRRQRGREAYQTVLERLRLDRPTGLGERLYQWLLLGALAEAHDPERPLVAPEQADTAA